MGIRHEKGKGQVQGQFTFSESDHHVASINYGATFDFGMYTVKHSINAPSNKRPSPTTQTP